MKNEIQTQERELNEQSLIIQSSLTNEQEDFLIESGLEDLRQEREREKEQDVNDWFRQHKDMLIDGYLQTYDIEQEDFDETTDYNFFEYCKGVYGGY
jgi:hypothetical protein